MTADDLIAVPGDAADGERLRALMRVPGYRNLFVSSLLWHTTRWGVLFTTSYLLTQIADSPVLNQVVGALFFVPMLLGGFFAGVISDRFERKRLILVVQLLLIPVEFLMFAAVQSGRVEVWMTFPFMFFVGIGGLVNMTAQRPLIYETVGPRLASRAMTIEATSQAGSAMFGTLVGGILIQQLGMGAGFAGMGLMLVASAVLLAFVPQPQYAATPLAAGSVSLRNQVATSASLLRRSRRFVAMLVITVVMNLCMFGYIPLIPVVAEDFAQSAVLAGALAAAPGLGQITAGVVLSTRQLYRYGTVFACGSAIALLGLLVFATVPVLAVAFVALFVAGIGQAGFGSMQSLLAIESAGPHERGVALGVLSTAIGALPIGMAVIGLGAELFGTRAALITSSLVGLVVLGVIVLRSRRDLLGPNPPVVLEPI
ncbi:MFS transporter [Mycolicibacterium frederiksbergense]|uniref:MFS transporter n=1 Tax=Mycolicibacterium frederiksbergense TaxID=117567 RepID=UPI00265BF506|nr:MFS transporter [Mycolicibacterium frederiksbergense]MDO0975324.1 MFS transporter [Mycolicibacterium frederiksbergense]